MTHYQALVFLGAYCPEDGVVRMSKRDAQAMTGNRQQKAAAKQALGIQG